MKNKISSVILLSGCVSLLGISCSSNVNTNKDNSLDTVTGVIVPPVQETAHADSQVPVNPPKPAEPAPAEASKNVSLWTELQPGVLKQPDIKEKFKSYKVFALDSLKMQKILAKAPSEKERNNEALKVILEIPRPDGGFMKFRIYRTTVMDPALEAQYPLLRTYGGQGIDDPSANIRLDFNQNGFHSYVISQAGEWFIDPAKRGITHQLLLCYFKRDVIVKKRRPFELPDSLRR